MQIFININVNINRRQLVKKTLLKLLQQNVKQIKNTKLFLNIF